MVDFKVLSQKERGMVEFTVQVSNWEHEYGTLEDFYNSWDGSYFNFVTGEYFGSFEEFKDFYQRCLDFTSSHSKVIKFAGRHCAIFRGMHAHHNTQCWVTIGALWPQVFDLDYALQNRHDSIEEVELIARSLMAAGLEGCDIEFVRHCFGGNFVNTDNQYFKEKLEEIKNFKERLEEIKKSSHK